MIPQQSLGLAIPEANVKSRSDAAFARAGLLAESNPGTFYQVFKVGNAYHIIREGDAEPADGDPQGGVRVPIKPTRSCTEYSAKGTRTIDY